MPIQIWNRGGDFLGGLQQRHSFVTEHFLSEAGSIEIEAPYSTWRDLISGDMRHALVEVTGPNGERVLRGRWLSRGDEPEAPAAMVGYCADLLEELRLPCIAPEYYVAHHSILAVLAELLSLSDTGWVLGDTGLAADIEVSANLAGMSFLEAIIDLCQQSGNHFRYDGWNRVLDVFAEPFPDVAAYLVCANPDDALPPGRGRVEMLRPDMEGAEVLRAVWPEGGNYKTDKDEDKTLRPLGTEELPEGFSFESVGGQIAIANDAVDYGLARVADFHRIQPLSNVGVDASGFVEMSGVGSITSEALRRPEGSFWLDGILEVGGQEYEILHHGAEMISGGWNQAFPAGTPFSVRKSFPGDAGAVEEARQDLVNAACGLLTERQDDAFEINVSVTGLGAGLVKPGDTVRLECVGHVKLFDALTGEVGEHLWDGFRGDLVVISVGVEVRGTQLLHTFDLSDRLRLLPTDTGLREMRVLSPPGSMRARARGSGRRYTVNVANTDPGCASGGHQKTLTFPVPYGAPPAIIEAVALDEDYSVHSAGATSTRLTVCVTASVAFDHCAVLVILREP